MMLIMIMMLIMMMMLIMIMIMIMMGLCWASFLHAGAYAGPLFCVLRPMLGFIFCVGADAGPHFCAGPYAGPRFWRAGPMLGLIFACCTLRWASRLRAHGAVAIEGSFSTTTQTQQ
jgi:hypothetical protein